MSADTPAAGDTLPLVAAMTGQDPAALVPGALIFFGGVTSVGLRRMREAGVEMAMARRMVELIGPDSMFDGRLGIDGYLRPGIVFEAITLAFDSPEDALTFLAETGRPLVQWTAERGATRTFITIRFDHEELVPA